jgi:hypothetical protein
MRRSSSDSDEKIVSSCVTMRDTLAYICASAADGAFEALPSTLETGAEVEEDEEAIGAEEEEEDAGTDGAAVLRGCCGCCCLAAAAFGTSSPVVSVDLRTLPTEAVAAEDEDDEEEEEEDEAAAAERPEAGAVEGRAECGARADGAADEAAEDDDVEDAASLAASVSSITRSKFVFHTIASSSHPPDAKKSPAGEKRAHSVDDWWPWIV